MAGAIVILCKLNCAAEASGACESEEMCSNSDEQSKQICRYQRSMLRRVTRTHTPPYTKAPVAIYNNRNDILGITGVQN